MFESFKRSTVQQDNKVSQEMDGQGEVWISVGFLRNFSTTRYEMQYTFPPLIRDYFGVHE
jgi:hypothetical protein